MSNCPSSPVLVRTYQCPVKSLTSGAGGGGGWVCCCGGWVCCCGGVTGVTGCGVSNCSRLRDTVEAGLLVAIRHQLLSQAVHWTRVPADRLPMTSPLMPARMLACETTDAVGAGHCPLGSTTGLGWGGGGVTSTGATGTTGGGGVTSIWGGCTGGGGGGAATSLALQALRSA